MTYRKKHLSPTNVILQTWTKENPGNQREIEVQVEWKGRVAKLPLLVMKGEGPSLVGRNWFPMLGIQLTDNLQLQEKAIPRRCKIIELF